MATKEEVTGKALDVADKALDGVAGIMSISNQVANKLGELATAHGQQAIDLGLNVVRVNALGGAFFTTILLAIFITYNIAIKKVWNRNSNGWASDEKLVFISFTVAIPNLILTLLIIATTSIWDFVGIFYPELWVANEIISKM